MDKKFVRLSMEAGDYILSGLHLRCLIRTAFQFALRLQQGSLHEGMLPAREHHTMEPHDAHQQA